MSASYLHNAFEIDFNMVVATSGSFTEARSLKLKMELIINTARQDSS